MTESMRALAWDHGCLSLQRLAGMLGPVTFLLPDGRQISPLQIAPWFADPRRETLPGVLRRLRGEWPCAPFGADAPRNLPEGWAADGETFAGADLAGPRGIMQQPQRRHRTVELVDEKVER